MNTSCYWEMSEGREPHEEKNIIVCIDLALVLSLMPSMALASETAGQNDGGSSNSNLNSIPDITFDYENEVMSGFHEDTYYSIKVKNQDEEEVLSETHAEDDNSHTMRIEEAWFGKTLEIVKKSSKDNIADSEPLELSVPVRPAAPEAKYAFTLTPGFVELPKKGNENNEYRIVTESSQIGIGTGSWTDIGEGVERTFENSVWIEIRTKASQNEAENVFASKSQSLKVDASGKAFPSVYNANINFDTDTTKVHLNHTFDVGSSYKLVANKYDTYDNGIRIYVMPSDFQTNGIMADLVEYSSNNESIASINGNILTIKGEGDVTITARRKDTGEAAWWYLTAAKPSSSGGSSSGSGGGSSSSSSSSQATQASNTSSGEIVIKSTADSPLYFGGFGDNENMTAVEWKLTSSSANSSGNQQVILSSNQMRDLINAANQNNADVININMQSSSEGNNSSNNDNSNNENSSDNSNNGNNSGSNTSTTFQTSNSDMKNLAESTDADLMLQSDAGSMQLSNEDLNNIASNLSEDGSFSIEMSSSNPTDTPVPGGMQALNVKFSDSSNSDFLSMDNTSDAILSTFMSNSNFYMNSVDIGKLASADSPAVLCLKKSSAQDLGMVDKLSITDVQLSAGQVGGSNKWTIQFSAVSNNDAENQGTNNKEQSLAEKIRQAEERWNNGMKNIFNPNQANNDDHRDEFGPMNLSYF